MVTGYAKIAGILPKSELELIPAVRLGGIMAGLTRNGVTLGSGDPEGYGFSKHRLMVMAFQTDFGGFFFHIG